MALTEWHSTFLRDPLSVFLRVIEHARAPLSFENIKARLVHSGLSEHSVMSQWARYEQAIKDDAHVAYTPETRTFLWGRAMALPDAAEAVQRLASGKAQINPDRKVLGEIVLAALAEAAHNAGRHRKPSPTVVPETPAPQAPAPPAPVPQAPADSGDQRILEERLKGDSARAYAKVAMELEELIISGASARTLLQRIHAAAQAHGLRPIESAGATIRFDRLRHDAVVASTQDGSEVLVIRPGYVWQAGGEEVLVAKAVVIEQ